MEETYYRDIEYATSDSENGTEPEIREIYRSLMNSVPDFHRFVHAINTAMMKSPI